MKQYTQLGCWADQSIRAVPFIDVSDPQLTDDYKSRSDAIKKCFEVAKKRKMLIFAIQDGGQCFADDRLDGYQKYGESTKCIDGKGGLLANDVYRILQPLVGEYPQIETNCSNQMYLQGRFSNIFSSVMIISKFQSFCWR